ncbi:MAG: PIG-L deacetylase family protein [candidate division Zixibacteria bacterium]|nr:PIG-L deacetylase family protein [candidate division Zixibacteria bacterium]
MNRFSFQAPKSEPFRLLCLGAHSDDIEIGCGGTILRLTQEYPKLEVCWIVFSGTDERESEARVSAELFLADVKKKEVRVEGYRDGHFPYNGSEIKDYFERIKSGFQPDLIFTHTRADLHQDHREIANLTWNTFRDHTIFEYEIPKYDADLGSPNLFVGLDHDICQRKVQYLLQAFKSQSGKHWFTSETFYALLRLRGLESASPFHYAEAFYARKVVL